MRALTTALAVSLAVAVAAPSGAATASAHGDAHATKANACRYVKLGGKRTCLAPGRSCKLKYQSAYIKRGFTCKFTKQGFRLSRQKQAF